MLKRVTALFLSLAVAWTFCMEVTALDSEDESAPPHEDEGVEERLIRGFENFEESIDISKYCISPDSLPKLFSDVTKSSPYLFYVGNELLYTYRRGGNVISLTPQYTCTREEGSEMAELCRSEIKRLAAMAALGENDLERVGYAHDLLCLRFSYDLTLESRELYSFLCRKEGTCQGYTWAYMAILNELQIECEYVASDKINHIWLKLKLDGEWYNSDVTWDDPPSGEGDGSTVSRRHFLFSDSKAERDGYVETYSGGDEPCRSESYDTAEEQSYHLKGDIDHSGEVDLYDLVALRRYVELGESAVSCPICADASGDLMLGEADADALRALILNGGS